jgi:CRP/FNR family transcriptional regulator, cyclic AMP receptor protein
MRSNLRIVKILSGLKIFQGISKKEIDLIAKITIRESFNKEELIFEDSTPGQDLYVIISGKVKITIESITPNESVILKIVQPGEILGEFALIDLEPRSATAICLEKTDMLIINGKQLHQLFEKNNHLGYIAMKNIAGIVCERIRRMNRMLLTSLRLKDY